MKASTSGNVDELKHSAEIFDALEDYKDSQALAESCRQEAEQETRRKTVVIVASVVIIAICVIATIITRIMKM